MQHCFDMQTHRLLGRFDDVPRCLFLLVLPTFDRPAGRQVAMQRVVRGGLIGDGIRAHAAAHEFRKNLGGVAEQRDGARFSFRNVARYAGQRVVEVGGLLIDIARAQSHVDTALTTLDGEHRRTRHGRGQGLRAAHAAQARGQDPAPLQVTAEVLASHLDEGFVGALHDALRADVNPRAGGHLPVHRQPFRIQLVEVLPGRPVRHQIGVRQQHTRRIRVARKHTHRLAALHQQGLVVLETLQHFNDGVETGPVARGAADAAVHHQCGRVFGDIRVEVVHQHAQCGFGQPTFAAHTGAAWCANDARRIKSG